MYRALWCGIVKVPGPPIAVPIRAFGISVEHDTQIDKVRSSTLEKPSLIVSMSLLVNICPMRSVKTGLDPKPLTPGRGALHEDA